MKLFHCPGSCSTGTRILLEEIGVDYQIELMDLGNRDQFRPDFRALNPKGKVPCLVRPDGSVITEFQTIAYWLGVAYPQANILRQDEESRVRALEPLDYIVASVHMRAFTLFIMPTKFHPNDPAAQKSLKAFGLSEIKTGLACLSEILGDKAYALGDFSIVDAALFYVLRYAEEFHIDLPDNLQAYYENLHQRPSVIAATSDIPAIV